MIPREPRHAKRLARNQILRSAKIGWPTLNSSKPKCAAIFRWFEDRNGQPDHIPTLNDILDDQCHLPRELTIQTVHQALTPLEELWHWKHQFSAPNLTFDPFPRGASIIASRLGREAGRHPTIPPKLALRYLNDALRWVLDYAPVILDEIESGVDIERLVRKLKAMGLDIQI